MGHEYVGIVEEVGSEVTTIKPGQFVVGSFCASDGTCEHLPGRLPELPASTGRARRRPVGLLRVPLADGTLFATPDLPDDDLIPSLLALSDVMSTGWFAAVTAQAGPDDRGRGG